MCVKCIGKKMISSFNRAAFLFWDVKLQQKLMPEASSMSQWDNYLAKNSAYSIYNWVIYHMKSNLSEYEIFHDLFWISDVQMFGMVNHKNKWIEVKIVWVYQQIAIRLLSTIRTIGSAIRWAITKVILNYLRLPSLRK